MAEDLLILIGHGTFEKADDWILLPDGVTVDFFCEDIMGIHDNAADSISRQLLPDNGALAPGERPESQGVTEAVLAHHSRNAQGDYPRKDRYIQRHRYSPGDAVRNYTMTSILEDDGRMDEIGATAGRAHVEALGCANVKTTRLELGGLFQKPSVTLDDIIQYALKNDHSKVANEGFRIEWLACREPGADVAAIFKKAMAARLARIEADLDLRFTAKGNAAALRDAKVLATRMHQDEASALAYIKDEYTKPPKRKKRRKK